MQLTPEQHTAMVNNTKVQAVYTDTRIVHQQASSPNVTPTATTLNTTAAAAAGPTSADTSATMPSASPTPNSTASSGGQKATTMYTQTSAGWDIDITDQKSLPLDGLYEYTNLGTGVNIYILDTVWHQW